MTEAQVFELIGRKQAALDVALTENAAIRSDYTKLLAVVKSIKEGADIGRLTIHDDGSWTMAKEEKAE